MRRWELRYEAMAKAELEEEANRYLRHDGQEWSPDRLDVLNAAIVRAGVKDVGYSEVRDTIGDGEGRESGPVVKKPFGQWIEDRHGREPWRQMVPEVVRSLELYEQPFGYMRVLDENGRIEELETSEAYMEKSSG